MTYDFDSLFKSTSDILELFSRDDFLTVDYDKESQKTANDALNDIARKTGTFDKTKSREEANINNGLTIIDKDTGKREILIDIDSMKERVDSVLGSNDAHSCLKTLAVSNKCAHSLDGDIEDINNYIDSLYKTYYSQYARVFYDELNTIYPLIKESQDKYLDLIKRAEKRKNQYISAEEFDNIYNKIENSNDIDTQKEVLDFFGIDYKNDKDVSKKIQDLQVNKKGLLDSYMHYLHDVGKQLLLDLKGKSKEEEKAIKTNLHKIRDNIYSLYKKYYNKTTFLRQIKDTCPKVIEPKQEYTDYIKAATIIKNRYISAEEFNDIYDKISRKTFIGDKKEILDYFGIKYEDDDDAKNKFSNLKKNRRKLLDSYMHYMYNIGRSLVMLQSNLFFIKSLYISMICQLLKRDKRFENIKHEIIHTKNAEEGFEYMLAIDDPSLSYIIEVHMPNYIAVELVNNYGYEIVEEDDRETPALGASAVYRRDFEEAGKIKEKLDAGQIAEPTKENGFARIRAKVISRGLDSQGSGDEPETSYKFHTNIIIDEDTKSSVKLFLQSMGISRYDDTIRFCDSILENENYPRRVTKEIVNNYYFNIYQSFNEEEKENFIIYSLYNNKEIYKSIDKKIVDRIRRIYEKDKTFDKDILANVLIYKDTIIDNYKKEIKDKNIVDINNIVDNYILDKYDKLSNNINNIVETNDDKRKRR